MVTTSSEIIQIGIDVCLDKCNKRQGIKHNLFNKLERPQIWIGRGHVTIKSNYDIASDNTTFKLTGKRLETN